MRVECFILLNSIDKVKYFTDKAGKLHKSRVYVENKNQRCDGKSIMGLFSMNLLYPMRCVIKGNSEAEIDTFYNSLTKHNIVLSH